MTTIAVANGLVARLENGEPVKVRCHCFIPLLELFRPGDGILLTGMGDDGQGLLEMKRSGCHTLVGTGNSVNWDGRLSLGAGWLTGL
jgi:hypothetical protein